MPLIHIAVLALIQGVTEFLPISSSAHLILVPAVTGWPDQGLLIDVAVHVGTLFAVTLYFWRDIVLILAGAGGLILGRGGRGPRLTLHLVVATLPVIAFGVMVDRYAVELLRNPAVIAWTTLGFGLLLYAADRLGMTVRRIEHMTLGNAAFIGFAQALALIPGTSRSGITMTAARMLGFERTEAARFSLLLSIPTILGAGGLAGYDLYRLGNPDLGLDAGLAAGLSFVAALVAIAVMMEWLRRASFAPFVLYRLALGIGLLVWLYL